MTSTVTDISTPVNAIVLCFLSEFSKKKNNINNFIINFKFFINFYKFFINFYKFFINFYKFFIEFYTLRSLNCFLLFNFLIN